MATTTTVKTEKEIKAARDKRLKELEKATTDWADIEIKRLKNEVSYLKDILQGRTGAKRIANQNVSDASALVVDEISQFLTG